MRTFIKVLLLLALVGCDDASTADVRRDSTIVDVGPSDTGRADAGQADVRIDPDTNLSPVDATPADVSNDVRATGPCEGLGELGAPCPVGAMTTGMTVCWDEQLMCRAHVNPGDEPAVLTGNIEDSILPAGRYLHRENTRQRGLVVIGPGAVIEGTETSIWFASPRSKLEATGVRWSQSAVRFEPASELVLRDSEILGEGPQVWFLESATEIHDSIFQPELKLAGQTEIRDSQAGLVVVRPTGQLSATELTSGHLDVQARGQADLQSGHASSVTASGRLRARDGVLGEVTVHSAGTVDFVGVTLIGTLNLTAAPATTHIVQRSLFQGASLQASYALVAPDGAAGIVGNTWTTAEGEPTEGVIEISGVPQQAITLTPESGASGFDLDVDDPQAAILSNFDIDSVVVTAGRRHHLEGNFRVTNAIVQPAILVHEGGSGVFDDSTLGQVEGDPDSTLEVNNCTLGRFTVGGSARLESSVVSSRSTPIYHYGALLDLVDVHIAAQVAGAIIYVAVEDSAVRASGLSMDVGAWATPIYLPTEAARPGQHEIEPIDFTNEVPEVKVEVWGPGEGGVVDVSQVLPSANVRLTQVRFARGQFVVSGGANISGSVAFEDADIRLASGTGWSADTLVHGGRFQAEDSTFTAPLLRTDWPAIRAALGAEIRLTGGRAIGLPHRPQFLWTADAVVAIVGFDVSDFTAPFTFGEGATVAIRDTHIASTGPEMVAVSFESEDRPPVVGALTVDGPALAVFALNAGLADFAIEADVAHNEDTARAWLSGTAEEAVALTEGRWLVDSARFMNGLEVGAEATIAREGRGSIWVSAGTLSVAGHVTSVSLGGGGPVSLTGATLTDSPVLALGPSLDVTNVRSRRTDNGPETLVESTGPATITNSSFVNEGDRAETTALQLEQHGIVQGTLFESFARAIWAPDGVDEANNTFIDCAVEVDEPQ